MKKSGLKRLREGDRAWLKGAKVLIVDPGWWGKNLLENNKDYQNDYATAIIRCYRRDLGFRKPKYFDPKKWEEQGIRYVQPWKGKFEAIRKVKLLSTMRKQRVFILWGRKPSLTVLRFIHPNKGHLILVGGQPGTSPQYRYWIKQRWFSRAADFLGESREMWRL